MNWKALGLSVAALVVVFLFGMGLVALASYSKALAISVVALLGLCTFYQCFKD